MKVVILAGGLGTRISEESHLKPKPMIEIGGKPILWHIMKMYSAHGFNEFIICAGYKGYVIKEYFANYYLHNSDITFDLKNNQIKLHRNDSESWTVTVVDTGEKTMTGGRLKRVREYLDPSESFHMTYGDGVSDVDLTKLVAFHRSHEKLATVTATQPPGRFGMMNMVGKEVRSFCEKPKGDGGYINGGFFVLSPKILETISGDTSIWERESLEKLSTDGELMAYPHHGFWCAMDTLRDKTHLEDLWNQKAAPWNIWS